MKILVISRNAWDDTNSIGNTLTNFFSDIKDVEIANIYFRPSKPNNKVCQQYYRVTEKDIIKNWFFPNKIGKTILQDQTTNNKKENIKEKRIIRLIHKYNLKSAYLISNYLWRSEKWINEKLDNFIEKFSPDLVFSFVKASPQYVLTIKHLREKYNIPLFCWIADDEYSGYKNKNQHKNIEALKYILEESSIVKGCSEEICRYYNSIFNCNSTPLYKGCNLTTPVKTHINSPIKIVYAGNLLYGRKEMLNLIIDALEKYNQKELKANLDIYSNTQLSTFEEDDYTKKRSVNYLGKRDYNTVAHALGKADIVLHVESFDNKEIIKTKYSFSTKIIDCLQSGSVMLAIGPKEISSMKYIDKIDGAFVISKIENIECKIYSLLDEGSKLLDRANKIRKFAIKNHDISINSKEMSSLLNKVIGGE